MYRIPYSNEFPHGNKTELSSRVAAEKFNYDFNIYIVCVYIKFLQSCNEYKFYKLSHILPFQASIDHITMKYFFPHEVSIFYFTDNLKNKDALYSKGKKAYQHLKKIKRVPTLTDMYNLTHIDRSILQTVLEDNQPKQKVFEFG